MAVTDPISDFLTRIRKTLKKKKKKKKKKNFKNKKKHI